MKWQHKLGPISKAKVHVHNHVEPTWIPYHRSTSDQWQNEQRRFFSRHLSATSSSLLSAQETIGYACGQLLSSQACDDKIIHENSGHDFHAASTIFAGLSAQ
jgi:hypothetical protein